MANFSITDKTYFTMGRWSRLKTFGYRQRLLNHVSVVARKKLRLPRTPTSPCFGGHDWKICLPSLPALPWDCGHDGKNFDYREHLPYNGRWSWLTFSITDNTYFTMGRWSRLKNFDYRQRLLNHGSVVAKKKLRLPRTPSSPCFGGHDWKLRLSPMPTLP